MPRREEPREGNEPLALGGPGVWEAHQNNERRLDAPVRNANVRGDGNFRTKNTSNVMPKAG
jgi:hypothetical protein